jgi:hypothetical protein
MGELIPIVGILATAWVIVTIWRGKPATGGGAGGSEDNARLVRENEQLNHTIDRLEERIAVLERIATDPAERTAREIENLR